MPSDTDFAILLTAVARMIESHRAASSPADIVDVATGLMCLSELDRKNAIVELCRTAIEREVKPIIENLIHSTANRLNGAALVDAAILAIALCGADEAHTLFPIDY